MTRTEFSSKIDSKNTYNCYTDDIKIRAKSHAFPSGLYTMELMTGVSFVSGNRFGRHHVYPKILFPLTSAKGRVNNTLRIIVSQARHLELHRLLAEEKYDQYEKEIIAESNGQITDHIAQNILNRIAQI